MVALVRVHLANPFQSVYSHLLDDKSSCRMAVFVPKPTPNKGPISASESTAIQTLRLNAEL